VAVLAASCASSTTAVAQPKGILLYVATNGNDAWSGRLAARNAGKTDGPFATIVRARDAIRELKRAGRLDRPVTVQVRGGTYFIDQAITLKPDDSGSEGQPVTYAAYPGEEPVLCGGREIAGWTPYRDGIYVAELPEVRAGGWYFRQLFADGKRQARARYPNVRPTDPLRKGFLYCQGIGGFGESVGCIHNVGDWMDYQIEAPADGEYTVWMYYAALNRPHGNTDMAGRTSLTVEGREPVALMNLPDTGGWGVMKWTRSAVIELTQGRHKVRWQNHKGGGLNFDAFVLCDDPKWEPKGVELDPPAANVHRITVQAEKFAAYHGPQLRIGGSGGSKTYIGCEPGTARPTWVSAPDAEVHIFQSGSCRAFKEIVQIESVEPDGSGIRVKGKECITFLRKGDRYFVENVFEELDAPGEWYLDAKAGRLYYYPTSTPIEKSRIVAPVTGRVFELLGDAGEGAFVEHLCIDGFTIQETDYSPNDGCEGYRMGCEGTIHMAECHHCSVTNCRFVNIGKYALCAADSRDCRFARSEVAHAAEGGVVLINSHRNQVTDCYLHDLGAIYKHIGGVVLERGSGGNLVAHNLIHDSARYGITLKNPGARNIIELNELFRLNLETYDTGGIEMTQHDRTFLAHSVIRNNVVRDCVGYSSNFDRPLYCSWGIYLDSFVSGYEVYNNVTIRNSHGGLMIQGGPDNYVHNNIFVDSTQRQMSLNNFRSHSKRNRVERNIFCFAEPDAWLMAAYRPGPDVTRLDHNLYFHTQGKPLQIHIGHPKGTVPFAEWQQLGFDEHSIVADPLFVDPGKGDYSLRADSPAFKLGLKPIDVSQVGPRP